MIHKNWQELLLNSKTQKTTFIFVFGHGDIKGNEGVDSLASTVTIMDEKGMDWADIMTALRDIWKISTFVMQ